MLFLLALFACEPLDATLPPPDVAVDAAAAPSEAAAPAKAPARKRVVPLPAGEPIVRTECLPALARNNARLEAERAAVERARREASPVGAKPRPRPRPSPSPAPMRPAASPAPPPPAKERSLDLIRGGGAADASMPVGGAPEAESAPAMVPGGTLSTGAPTPVESAGTRQGGQRDRAKRKSKDDANRSDTTVADRRAEAQAPADPAVTRAERRQLEALGYVSGEAGEDDGLSVVDLPDADADGREAGLGGEELAKARGPTLDWGATVYLSNDDSMSLASAQRVLWATQNGKALQPRDIRPHELLNYFNFDTADVPSGETFSVHGSAVLEDDQLTVALAFKGATPERQPLDLSFVVDRSCSMQAEGRMDYTKRGLAMAADQLQRGDRVDVVLFDSGVCTPLENFVVGRDDPELLDDVLGAIEPKGSTDLDAGLREAYRIHTSRSAADVHRRNRRVLLLTDANLNTGNVDEDLVSEVGRQFEDNGVRLTGVGVGRDFNDRMLDKLTEKGKGAYVYLGSEAVVDRVFGPGFGSLTQTIAHDVRFSMDLPPSLAMERFYGEEASTDPEDVMPINYYAGTSQLFLQDLTARDLDPRDPIVVNVSWRDAATGEPDALRWKTTVGALLDGDARNVHKARALMAWSDVLMTRAMGADGCSDPLDAYVTAARAVGEDAELAFLDRLTGGLCRVDLTSVAPPGVAYRVKVDSDTPIAGVNLACGRHHSRETLTGSDTVATFDDAVAGDCTLVLEGAVGMRVPVTVPSTGGAVRCVVRGGRVTCG